ncbi:diguanylate cyclase domain-containing protein [Nitratifractor sp.]
MALNDLMLLLVEDDPIAQEQLKLYFEDQFETVLQAYNGLEGLDLYRRYAPDIILTDLRMPGLSGLDMIAEIRKENPDQVIMIFSALNDSDTLLKSLNLSVDGFIPKPILDLSIVEERLKKVAEKIRSKSSEERHQIHQLYQKAYFDALTRIYNRNYFDDYLRRVILSHNDENSLALLIIDMDNLKEINDRYGHATGDRALVLLTDTLRRTIPEKASLVRLGGDEFAVILPGINHKNISGFLQEIESLQGMPLQSDGGSPRISFSIGCSFFPDDARTVDELLAHADEAMYRAKRSGKGRTFFYEEQ